MADYRYQYLRSGAGFDLGRTAAERPVPGPGDVLLRVRAVSINRRDIMIMKGWYPVGEANGFTPLSDAAGEIVAVGPGVSTVAVGDTVCSTFFQNWPDGRITGAAIMSSLGAGGPGVLAQYVVLSAAGVTPMPAGWSFEAAATLPCAAVTAWSSLTTHGGIKAGDWVLALGTGGVAIFGLQIATALGARTIVTSSSDAKLERAVALGAAATVNYTRQPDWDEAVRALTGGVDHVLELGGAGTLGKSIASLGTGGHLALIGALAGFGGEISAVDLMMGAKRVTAVTVGSRADQSALSAFLAAHSIQPEIDSVFDIGQIDQAYARADAGAFGKVVVRLD